MKAQRGGPSRCGPVWSGARHPLSAFLQVARRQRHGVHGRARGVRCPGGDNRSPVPALPSANVPLMSQPMWLKRNTLQFQVTPGLRKERPGRSRVQASSCDTSPRPHGSSGGQRGGGGMSRAAGRLRSGRRARRGARSGWRSPPAASPQAPRPLRPPPCRPAAPAEG